MKRSRDIRAERRAKELARHMGWNSPMPEREDGEPGEEPVQDERTPIGPFDVQRPAAPNT